MAWMRWWLAAGVSIVALLAPPAAGAQTSAATKEQIERMEAQLAALKRDLAGMQKKLQSPEKANAQSAEKAHAAAAPISAAPSSGPTVKMPASNRAALCSADGRNCIAFTSRIQFD